MKLNRNVWVYRDGQCVPGVVLGRDGESLFTERGIVQFEDGQTDSYRFSRMSVTRFDPPTYDGWKTIKRIDRWVLTGNDRRSFKPRETKTEWTFVAGPRGSIAGHPDMRCRFDTLDKAVIAAFRYLEAELDKDNGFEEVEIMCSRDRVNGSGSWHGSDGCAGVMVYNDGSVIRFSFKRHNLTRLGEGHMNRGVYMRDCGKGKRRPYYPRRVWFGGRRQKATHTAVPNHKEVGDE